MTYSWLLQLMDHRSVVDGTTYFHRLSHNDPMAGMTMAFVWQVHDGAVPSTKPATGLTKRISAVDPNIWTLITKICLSQWPSTVRVLHSTLSAAIAWQTFQIMAVFQTCLAESHASGPPLSSQCTARVIHRSVYSLKMTTYISLMCKCFTVAVAYACI